MKALTISQPFASLIADGEKWIENRTWGTNHVGMLAIHAGKGLHYLTRGELKKYPQGIVATCNLVACFRLEDVGQLHVRQMLMQYGLCADDILDHTHTEGPWCWLLRNVRKLEKPVPCRGAQGLWEWEHE